MIGALFMSAALAASPAQGGQKPAGSPGARRAVEKFSICVADTSPAKASAVLVKDFRHSDYQLGLRNLAKANEGCLNRTRENWLAANRLLIAGGIAERLLERDDAPVNVQLARAAQGPATESFSPSDAGAICVVRSAPDDVAALFASEVASPEEATAAQPLTQLLARCMGSQPVESSLAGLRAILATAAFRSVQTSRRGGGVK